MTARGVFFLVAIVALLVAMVAGDAAECHMELCSNSTCRCSSTETPGAFEFEDVPQFVILTFDEAVTSSNFPFYETLTAYKNPNGCNITMTFFVSHENTDYTLVNKLHRFGHEISTRSVSSLADIGTYWRNMTEEAWLREINDMKTILTTFANIPADDIKGFRVPYLEVGGNLMYKVLSDSGFEYDSSWPTLLYTPWYPNSQEAFGTLWPYTLDYLSIQEQTVGTKPTDSFPGMWVSPMTDMQDNRGEPCPMLDLCLSSEDGELETSSEAVFDLLKRNFKAHYYNGRTPFGLYTREAWFKNDELTGTTARHDGFTKFLSYLSSFPDVYLGSVNQVIQWTKDPQHFEDLPEFEPMKCFADLPVTTCPSDNNINCHYDENLPIDQVDIYMKICEGPCPLEYPWLGNPTGAAQPKQ